jgi:hypothetical protein
VIELSEEVALALAAYLEAHPVRPVRGMGTVREAFQEHPPMEPPKVEALLRHGTTWFVRWPGGSLRWVTETFLRERGVPLPPTPLVSEVE